MPTIQIIFYWVATISLILIGLMALVGIVATIIVVRKISQISRRMHLLMRETALMLDSLKSYTRYVGSGFMSGALGSLMRFFKGKQRYY